MANKLLPYQVGALINRLKKKATVLESLPKVSFSSDPKDNPILSSALQGQVQYLVSNDKNHMLKLEAVKGISIITARTFVEQFIKLEP